MFELPYSLGTRHWGHSRGVLHRIRNDFAICFWRPISTRINVHFASISHEFKSQPQTQPAGDDCLLLGSVGSSGSLGSLTGQSARQTYGAMLSFLPSLHNACEIKHFMYQ